MVEVDREMPNSRSHHYKAAREERAKEEFLETTSRYYNRPNGGNGGNAYDLYQVLCQARDEMLYLHYDPMERATYWNKRAQAGVGAVAGAAALVAMWLAKCFALFFVPCHASP